MKKIRAVLVGCGGRGLVYAKCSVAYRNEFDIVAVAEPNEERRTKIVELLGISKSNVFNTLQDMIDAKFECDIVIVATNDSAHYENAKSLLYAGYDILLEKPVTAKKEELLDLYNIQKQTGRLIIICHVLRYSPFYRAIKKHILNGDLGKIVSIELAEHVGVSHFISSFVHGIWKSEKECGSPLLLAKSCHDTDIMCWMNNETKPKEVVSFSDRKHFISSNAPVGHADNCDDCKIDCPYKIKGIKCVFVDHDLVDRQHLMVKFENGSIGSFQLIGGAPKADRYIHIVGEKGEIRGTWRDGRYELRTFDERDSVVEKTESFEIKDTGNYVGYHYGSDDCMVRELARFLNGEKDSVSITKLEDSINGHLLVYYAEESVKKQKIVEF